LEGSPGMLILALKIRVLFFLNLLDAGQICQDKNFAELRNSER
jgi:hypothetical protein